MVTVAGSSWAVTDVDVIESAVWLTLESAVTSTQTVAVSYTVPDNERPTGRWAARKPGR